MELLMRGLEKFGSKLRNPSEKVKVRLDNNATSIQQKLRNLNTETSN